MIMAALPFLDATPDPDEAQIRTAISGNLCRCTGYADIVRSIQWAARQMRGEVVAGADDEEPTWRPGAGPLGH
jgi:carbon-monoxide dehydrogenase small subunit